MGTELEAIKRHTNHSKSADVAGTARSTPGVDSRGSRAGALPALLPEHSPAQSVQQSALSPWPLVIIPCPAGI